MTRIKDSRKKTRICASLALEKKALDVVILEVKKLTMIADYFLICSATSKKHSQTICDSIEEGLCKLGIFPLGIEGYTAGEWILLDYDDVIVHVFYKPFRELYNLEKIWYDARRIEISEKRKGIRSSERT